MLSNVGHTIQKMINNTPVAITANDTTTTVVTNGGNAYHTGLIEGKIQYSFREIPVNDSIVGRIVDAEATEDKVYLLNSNGSVFEYSYNSNSCNIIVREVFSPGACGGDKAVQIKAGKSHVLILTENHKVWGAGNNEEYQIVPQGQCKYDTATEIFVTDTNLHDNDCCSSFTGLFNELLTPVIPTCEPDCNKISCVKNTLCDVLIGYLNVCQAVVSPPGQTGTLKIPIYGDVSYVGFLCIDKKGCASGSLTYTLTRLYIKCGCFVSKFVTNDSCGCHIKEFNTSSTTELLIFEANPCHSSKTDKCNHYNIPPITGTSQIFGKCGSCVVVNIDLPNEIELPAVSYDQDCKTILLDIKDCRSTLTALCEATFCGLCSIQVDVNLDFDVPLDCCQSVTPTKNEVQLPQPCWSNIYAGQDLSVLVDNCNRIYVFGSLHEIRSNKDLLKRSCLEEILNKTHASISFPADQLNCSTRSHKNNGCKCEKCRDKPFKTDLNKFGIHLNFPNGDNECNNKNVNVCDFLKSLKNCNESTSCDPTCVTCDGYIYLNVSGECGCPCGAPTASSIGSITLFNKKSVTKLVSQGCPDTFTLSANIGTIVEFDLNKYCIDTTDIPLEKVVKLKFCHEGPNVNIYLDIDQPGGVKITSDDKKYNVEFSVNASTQCHQFILNYGSILDPVELANLKYALSLDCYFPSPKYKNPFDTKITNTYLRGGDHVRFVTGNPKNIRQAITADVPTVFRLNRRIIDIAVGDNSLTVLVGGLGCPNELFAIGNNCSGELGIGSNETVLCWRQLNRCNFDCQVSNIFAGKRVTFYVTQSNRVYATGQWKCFVNSINPVPIKQICESWKIRQISITNSHIVFLGADGCVFGLGDNSLGELGLCHLDCVKKPTPLVFFYKLNGHVAKQLRDNLEHPVVKKNRPHHDNDRGCGPYNCPPPPPYCGLGYNKCFKGPKRYAPNSRIYPSKFDKY